VDQSKGAVPVVGLIEDVGKAGVDRKIVLGVRIHQLYRNRIEALGSLTVALMELRPKSALPPTDGVDLDDLEMTGGVLLPDFKFRLTFILRQTERVLCGDRAFARQRPVPRSAPSHLDDEVFAWAGW
jgi:hypothetical protein